MEFVHVLPDSVLTDSVSFQRSEWECTGEALCVLSQIFRGETQDFASLHRSTMCRYLNILVVCRLFDLYPVLANEFQ